MYVTYIVLYAVLSSVLGKWVDKQLAKKVSARDVLKYIGGVQFTILCVVILIATLIPRGAIALNPKAVEGATSIEEDEDEERDVAGSESEQGEKKPQLDNDYVHGHQLSKTGHGLGNDKLAQSSL